MEDFVIITAKQYRELLEKADQLELLECAGVDNWPGYEFMYDELQYEYPDMTQSERLTERDKALDAVVDSARISNLVLK